MGAPADFSELAYPLRHCGSDISSRSNADLEWLDLLTPLNEYADNAEPRLGHVQTAVTRTHPPPMAG